MEYTIKSYQQKPKENLKNFNAFVSDCLYLLKSGVVAYAFHEYQVEAIRTAYPNIIVTKTPDDIYHITRAKRVE